MIPPAVAQSIASRLVQGMPSLPVALPNKKFARPMDPQTKLPKPYLLLELAGDRFDQQSIGAPGSNLFRTEGRLAVHVFVARNTGDDDALQYVKQVRDLYCGQEIAGVCFRGATVYPGEDGDADGIYWRRTIVVEWLYDEPI